LAPVVALVLLTAVLGYFVVGLEEDAARVDRADQVITNTNRLLFQMVNAEAGVRGYFLTHDNSFLALYTHAELVLPPTFNSTLALVNDQPEVKSRLQTLRQNYREWHRLTAEELQDHAPIDLQARKNEMQLIRVETKSILRAELSHRTRAFDLERRMGSVVRWSLLASLLLTAAILAFWILRTHHRLESLYEKELLESERQRRLAAEREEWLHTTLHSIGDGVIVCDTQGMITLMNPVAETLTGWKEQEAKGRPLAEVFQIVNEHTRQTVENPVEQVLHSGKIVGLANHTLLIARHGREACIEDSAAPVRNTAGEITGIVLVFRDGTEQRSAQKALMRAEKLAAAGKLAASIAHEVNNPLEGLTNLLYLAGQSKDLEEVRHWLVQGQAVVDRLSHITRRTLGFYRENARASVYRPAEVVEEVLAFYVPEALSQNVRLEAQIRTQRETWGVPGELRQVLSNLLANSLDAMPDGGVIRLSISNAEDPRQMGKQGIRIVVADTGTGIPAALLRRVFEPFFTTKADTGTGLGLWVSKDLVEKQGGTLRVRSRTDGEKHGTVFSIFLPVHEAGELS
jgi:PAS domain S-box-containing protein